MRIEFRVDEPVALFEKRMPDIARGLCRSAIIVRRGSDRRSVSVVRRTRISVVVDRCDTNNRRVLPDEGIKRSIRDRVDDAASSHISTIGPLLHVVFVNETGIVPEMADKTVVFKINISVNAS